MRLELNECAQCLDTLGPGAQLRIFRGRGLNQKKGTPSFQSSDVIWDVCVCMCV